MTRQFVSIASRSTDAQHGRPRQVSSDPDPAASKRPASGRVKVTNGVYCRY